MRLHISIGIKPDGDPVAIYVGDDATQALAGLREAGLSGEIVTGMHFANPLPSKVMRAFPQTVPASTTPADGSTPSAGILSPASASESAPVDDAPEPAPKRKARKGTTGDNFFDGGEV